MSTAVAPADISIRPAEDDDASAIAAIYRPYVLGATCSFETEAPTDDEIVRRMRAVRGAGLPYLVAEIDGKVVGYAYAGRWRERSAYRKTCENTVYVAADRHGSGCGRRLLSELISACAAVDMLQMIAVIGGRDNAASIALHSRLGFREVGVLERVGFKHGRWLDTVLMQRSLG